MKTDIDIIEELEIGDIVDVFEWKNSYYHPENFKLYTGKILLVDKLTRILVIRHYVWYLFPKTSAFVIDKMAVTNPNIIVVKNYNRK